MPGVSLQRISDPALGVCSMGDARAGATAWMPAFAGMTASSDLRNPPTYGGGD